ncbi:MAG: hydantoinase/oxoprolinase family protein [Chloroflexi bacterium]|nr:hydantoinase/oxoprolinase family protein [Chloroflexota bacterium]
MSEIQFRIGIDVGGTNTDAVVMRGREVVGWAKRPTTPDVTSGIVAALSGVLAETDIEKPSVGAVMIGTTHFTNAVVQRRKLTRVAVFRLCGPATQSLPPMVDWPPDLRDAVRGFAALLPGGFEFDGRPIVPFDERALREACRQTLAFGLNSVAVSSVFSPVNTEHETRAAQIIREELPDAAISLSHEIGRLGLLERENAAIMNACLRDLGQKTIAAFRESLADLGLNCPLYLAQNDGTLMSADFAEKFPVYTFASGPTNSMRGAAFLSALPDAIVVDIGGTTTDVGALAHGFPREASVEVEVGGVRTNFRMPDVFSFGLGGGSIVVDQRSTLGFGSWDLGISVGPLSVGYELTTKARVFGGDTLTATDIAVAGRRADIGARANVADLDPALIAAGLAFMLGRVEEAIDRMKLSRDPVPVILVGGGSILVGDRLGGASDVVRPPHYQVANAVGAAIAQISGEIDRVVSLRDVSRDEAIAAAKQEAGDRAIAAGADPNTIHIVDVEDIPLAYLPSNATRVRAKAVGNLNLEAASTAG